MFEILSSLVGNNIIHIITIVVVFLLLVFIIVYKFSRLRQEVIEKDNIIAVLKNDLDTSGKECDTISIRLQHLIIMMDQQNVILRKVLEQTEKEI